MQPFVYVVIGKSLPNEQDIFAIFQSEEDANKFKEALEQSEKTLVEMLKTDPVKYEVHEFTLN